MLKIYSSAEEKGVINRNSTSGLFYTFSSNNFSVILENVVFNNNKNASETITDTRRYGSFTFINCELNFNMSKFDANKGAFLVGGRNDGADSSPEKSFDFNLVNSKVNITGNNTNAIGFIFHGHASAAKTIYCNVNVTDNSVIETTVPLTLGGRHKVGETVNYNFESGTALMLNGANAKLFNVSASSTVASANRPYTYYFEEGVSSNVELYKLTGDSDKGFFIKHVKENGDEYIPTASLNQNSLYITTSATEDQIKTVSIINNGATVTATYVVGDTVRVDYITLDYFYKDNRLYKATNVAGLATTADGEPATMTVTEDATYYAIWNGVAAAYAILDESNEVNYFSAENKINRSKIYNAPAKSKVVLYTDVEYSGEADDEHILVNNDLVVDLNNKTFTFKTNHRFSVNANGINFVIENGDAVTAAQNLVFIDKTSTATLNNVNVSNNGKSNAIFDVRAGKLVVNGGDFKIGATVINSHSRVYGKVEVEFNNVNIETTMNGNENLKYYLFGTLSNHSGAPTEGYKAETTYTLNNCTINSNCDYLYAYGRHMKEDSVLNFIVNGGSIKTKTAITKFYSGESNCNCNFVGNANAKVLNASFSDVYLNHVPTVEYGTLTYGNGQTIMAVEGSENGCSYVVAAPTQDKMQANLSLYSDFTLNLFVPVEGNVVGIVDGKYVVDEADNRVVIEIKGTNYYVISLEGIAPTDAANKIDVGIRFTVGNETRTLNAKYSVLNYVKDYLKGETTTEGTTLIMDTLAYIKAATLFVNSNADVSAVNDLLGSYTRVVKIPVNTVTIGDNDYIKSASFGIDKSVIKLKLTMKTNVESVTVAGIEGTVGDDGCVYVDVRAFMLVDEFGVCVNGSYVGTYSLASYYNSEEVQGKADAMAVVEAMYAYAESAKAYKTVNAE